MSITIPWGEQKMSKRMSKDSEKPAMPHARRGTRKPINLRPEEIDLLVVEFARGKKTAQVRESIHKTFGRVVSAGSVNYHQNWHRERIEEMREQIRNKGEFEVVGELSVPHSREIDDSLPFAERYSDQLPPDIPDGFEPR
jgi:hypothetical protein